MTSIAFDKDEMYALEEWLETDDHHAVMVVELVWWLNV